MSRAIGVCLFQFYGYLSQQQNMMQDYVRTGTYQRAILQNHTDFKDKVSPQNRKHTEQSLQCAEGWGQGLLPPTSVTSFVFVVLSQPRLSFLGGVGGVS